MIETDKLYMKKALLRAKAAARVGEVPVGALIVRNGLIVSTGRNFREGKNNAISHAEIIAIDRACRKLGRWRLFDCTLYVTLEPCPMCAGAIINARIPRVVFGAYDRKAGVFGSVTDLTQLPFNHKPEIVGGVLAEECGAQLSNFFKSLR